MTKIKIYNLVSETNNSELNLLDQDRVIGGSDFLDNLPSRIGLDDISVVGDITVGDIISSFELDLSRPFTPPTFPNQYVY